MTKNNKSYEQTYTHPRMREDIKEQIKASDKGGEPGQWSARKSQLLKQEYEKRGGGYKGEKEQSQRELTEWSQEEWQTKEGESQARQGDRTKRYLPKEAWQRMSEDEKQQAEEDKREGSKRGKQHVANPEEARQARIKSEAPPIESYDELNADEVNASAQSLSKKELKTVLDYEKRHRARKTVIEYLERRL